MATVMPACGLLAPRVDLRFLEVRLVRAVDQPSHYAQTC